MSYKQININQFKGLNSTVAPELIEDGEARDILNFRMEKIGKLVSRNGYICGLFTAPCPDQITAPICGRNEYANQVSSQVKAYVENKGVIGIGEFVLSEKWAEMDTDRFMVYVVRGYSTGDVDENDQDNTAKLTTRGEYPKRDFEFYLFSPLTGLYTNQLLTQFDDPMITEPASIDLSNKRDASPQGSLHTVPLYAPNKKNPGDSRTFLNNDAWIDHYIDISQYREQLVISDRVNGDMLLEDEWNRREAGDTTTSHELHLRPNCLESFDIDTVEFDPRFTCENSVTDGVETGMILYKFVLPKKTKKILQDNYQPDMLLESISPTGEDTLSQDDAQIAATRLLQTYHRGVSAFLSVYMFRMHRDDTPRNLFLYVAGTGGSSTYPTSKRQWDGVDLSKDYVDRDDVDTQGGCNVAYRVAEGSYYQFSNEQNPGEFDDILGELEFEENEYTDEDGKTVKESAPNIYKWDNYKIKYYPCSGNEVYHVNGTVTDFSRYLKDIDRMFEKLLPNVGRITELNAKDNAGRKVPLGVWKYRFVWDFGDGVYSAPSAEVVVPDIMWSATEDTDYWDGIAFNYTGRPNLLDQTDLLYKQGVANTNADYDASPGIFTSSTGHRLSPAIFTGAGVLTSLGESIFSLKTKLYDVTHKYGPQAATIAAVNALGVNEKGAFGVMVTSFFSESSVVMPGIIWEGCGISVTGAWNVDADTSPIRNFAGYNGITKNIVTNSGQLVIPIFKSATTLTFNSIFDDDGKYRRAYDEHSSGYRHQLVLAGHNYGIGHNILYRNLDISAPSKDAGTCVGGAGEVLNELHPMSEMLFAPFLSTGAESQIYYNMVMVENDKNNYDATGIEDARAHTLLRAVKNEADRLALISITDVPADALARLILPGTVEIELIKAGERAYFESQRQAVRGADSSNLLTWDIVDHYPLTTGSTGEIERTKFATREFPGTHSIAPYITVWHDAYNAEEGYVHIEPTSSTWIQAQNDAVYKTGYADNLGIYLYGDAERLTALEQLTAMFPSSILFEAPRLGIKIHNSLIPERAKKLLIFRTKCTHANDYEPTEFGLVEEVDLKRYSPAEEQEHGIITDVIYGTVISEMEGGAVASISGDEFYDGFYYFDDVKDSALDFAQVPIDFEGLRTPLKSRFNISVNERTFFLNFVEEYQPLAPRKNENNETVDAGGDAIGLPTADAVVMDSEDTTGFDETTYVRYKYVYEDVSGVISGSKTVNKDGTSITVSGAPTDLKVVVLYMMPSQYDMSTKMLKVYRAKATTDWGPNDTVNYYFIGEIEAGDEGVFLDNNQRGGALLGSTDPTILTYNSGMMESEPFRPDWIKPDKMYEYRSGDGSQITGVESLFGNIMIYKETSMHRVAVQGKSPAVSRTDEVSPNIGCIAPNTLINIDGLHYFLSWKGFVRYDNNQVQKIDGKFDEELQHILSVVPHEYLRDASCGYNRAYNEIYLNIPMLKTTDPYNRQRDYGHAGMYQKNEDNASPELFERTLLGHIYVINIDKGYVTKFAYPGTVDDLTYLIQQPPQLQKFVKDIAHPIQMIRLYYNNSLGELRSADVLPAKWDQSVGFTPESPIGKSFAGVWIETPYNLNIGIIIGNDFWNYRKMANGGTVTQSEDEQVYLTDYDDIINGARLLEDYSAGGYSQVITPIFPPLTVWPIRSEYRSKFFTGAFETLIKRVRKTLVNIFSRGGVDIKNITTPIHNETTSGDFNLQVGDRADERIENKPHQETNSNYGYGPSIDSTIQYGPYTAVGTGIGTNIIASIPKQLPGDDWHGKPIRYSVEIQSELRTQINSIEIYWRPIHTYLG